MQKLNNSEVVSKMAVNDDGDKLMSVTAYLKLHPQSSVIASLLKKKYPKDFKTESEWNEVLAELLNQKITH